MTTALSNNACGYCGGYHTGTCPTVKRITYHPNGTVSSVEFHDNRTMVGLRVCTCFQAGRNPECAVHGSNAGSVGG